MPNKISSLKHILILFSLLAVLCASCTVEAADPPLADAPAQASEAAEELIRPGDMIGEMVVTEAAEWTWDTNLHSSCEAHGDRIENTSEEGKVIIDISCRLNPGTEILLSCGGVMADPENGSDLDSNWSKLQTKMVIDGRELDMSAFGWVEFVYQEPVRTWNVQLEDLSPGMHMFYCETAYPGDPTYENTFHFDVRALTYPALPAEGAAGLYGYVSEKSGLNLLLYFPDAYGQDPQEMWPLVLYLHGGGEKGANLDRLKSDSLPKILESGSDLPFIVVSPQLSGKKGEQYWPEEGPAAAVLTLLEEIKSRYDVDQSRIYFTGYSDGGGGVWEIGLNHPEEFAALVPVSGYYGYPFEVPENICDLKDIPIWAFHGAEDDAIPLDAQQGLVAALEKCGGDIRFTVYPDRGHDIGLLPYSDQEVIEWLLEQKRE